MKIIEPVFANIRIQKRMDYLTLRGKVKVNIQWLLYCIVHNIGKIGGYGMGMGKRAGSICGYELYVSTIK